MRSIMKSWIVINWNPSCFRLCKLLGSCEMELVLILLADKSILFHRPFSWIMSQLLGWLQISFLIYLCNVEVIADMNQQGAVCSRVPVIVFITVTDDRQLCSVTLRDSYRESICFCSP